MSHPSQPSSSIRIQAPGPFTIGSETVINPEGRPTFREPEPNPHGSSSVWNTLFPNPDYAVQDSGRNLIGVELGHFRIEDRIRSGGMGAVFRALDTRLNRIVALKVLPPSQSRDFASVQRFRNEAKAAARLDHENIARVFYIGEDLGLHFIAFEYITGINVRELIQQQGRIAPADAVNYTLQIATALAHASVQGVVHRDIKPSNIIITPAGRAKLVDLGLARNENTGGADDLTVAGTTLGTFDYISPEQAKDPRSVDVRSDIYSLGCTLYHMLTGEPPYPEGTVLQKLLDHQAKDVPDPKLKNRHVSDDLSAIVRKMMASDSRRRYQSAEQLIRDLMLIAGSMGLRSLSPEGLIWMSSQNSRHSFWERHIGGVATVAVLFLIVGYLKYNTSFPNLPDAASLLGIPGESRVEIAAREGKPLETSPTIHVPRSLEPQLRPTNDGSPALDERGRDAPDGDQFPGYDSNPKRPIQTAAIEFRHQTDGGVSIGPAPSNTGIRLNSENATGSLLAPAESFEPGELRSGGPESQNKVLPTAKTGLPRPGGPLKSASSPGELLASRSPALAPHKNPEQPKPDPIKSVAPQVGEIVPTVASEQSQPSISILGPDGAPQRAYQTLEAACVAAEDGNVIELRFNGVRRESPLRINKKITIRAGKGYRPLVELVSVPVPAEAVQTRMITVSSGSLDLVDLQLQLSVREGISTDLWAMFSVLHPDSVRLQGVALTISNPGQRPATVAEFRASPSRDVADMELESNQLRTPVIFEMSECVVRGGADLFVARNNDGARFSIQSSVVALGGALLRTQGTTEMIPEMAQYELRLDHVTAVLDGGLVKMENGDLPRKLIPVHVSASNNILSTTQRDSLISMSGSSSSDDFRDLLRWKGQKNFYDRFQLFWTTSNTDSVGGKFGTMAFDGWKRHWGPGNEVDAHTDVVLWKKQWSDKRFWELSPVDFELDHSASGNNPAISGANNGDDAGVNLSRLAKLRVLPSPAREAGESR